MSPSGQLEPIEEEPRRHDAEVTRADRPDRSRTPLREFERGGPENGTHDAGAWTAAFHDGGIDLEDPALGLERVERHPGDQKTTRRRVGRRRDDHQVRRRGHGWIAK